MMDGNRLDEQAIAPIRGPMWKDARCAGARQHTLRRRRALPPEDMEGSALIEAAMLLLLMTMLTGATSFCVILCSDRELGQGLAQQPEPDYMEIDLSLEHVRFDEPAPESQGAR